MTVAPKHLPDEIASFHTRLNREGVVPAALYKRNHLGHALLSYVNTVTACLLCENYKVAALFVTRAASALPHLRNPEAKRPSEELAYYDLLEEYLKAVAPLVLPGDLAELALTEVPESWWPRGRGN